MEKRRLGRTGHMSSVVIMGTAAFSGDISQEDANKSLDLAEAHGVNHIDVAPTYGFAELRTGPWLEGRRDNYFVGCKTTARGAGGAWAELHRSLYLLRTDHFDVYQMHSIGTMSDLDEAMKSGSAIETLQRAKNEGLTKWIGITGHGMDAPATHYEALQRHDLDTVMFPIHPRLYADPKYRADTERLLDYCVQHDVGVQIIKAITRGVWGSQPINYNTWYQPYDVQAKIDEGVRFALSQPGVASIPSAGDTRLLPMILDAVERFTPMSADEQENLIRQSSELELMFQ